MVNSELTTIAIKLRNIHKLIKEEVEGMPNRPSALYKRDWIELQQKQCHELNRNSKHQSNKDSAAGLKTSPSFEIHLGNLT